MFRRIFIFFVFISVGGFSPSNALGKATPEDVAKTLMDAFTQGPTQEKARTSISKKRYLGFQTKTVLFQVGQNEYRIVFSGDGNVTVSLKQAGDIAAQPIWKAKIRKTSAESIVSQIYLRETGTPYSKGQRSKKVKKDQARKTVEDNAGDALRWNRLMNAVIKGDTASKLSGGGTSAGPSGGDSVGASVGMGKMMDPCSTNRGGASPQRAAIENLAQAMTTARLQAPGTKKGKSQFLSDRSREFQVQGAYSFFQELGSFEDQPDAQKVIRIVRKTKDDSYRLFRQALRSGKSIENENVYDISTLRNFQSVARLVGEKRGKELINHVLMNIVIDLDRFVLLRSSLPNSPVIHDRKKGIDYIDPTLTSPEEARFLLSLAVLYRAILEKENVATLMKNYENAQNVVKTLKQGLLDEKDHQKLKKAQEKVQEFSPKLFKIAEKIRKAASYPSFGVEQ